MGYFFAVVVGAVLAGAAQILVEYSKRVADQRGIASAFAGEISGIINVVETRALVGAFRQLANALRTDSPPPWPWYVVDITADASPIFKAYVGRIGSLPRRLPERVAQFYTVHLAIRTELKVVASELLKDKPAEAAARIDRTIPIWEKAAADGRILINDLLALSGVQPE